MRIEVLGGGPSGLYFAYLARLRLPGVRVVVHERNAPDATFGFGVVLAERGLENLAAADADSCARVRAIAKSLGDQQIVLEGVPVSIEGAEYGSAVPRLALLGTLQGLCDEVGVEQRFGDEIADPASLDGADLVVGADGANSTLRAAREDAFGTERGRLDNAFAWYGARLVHDRPTLSFRRVGDGAFCAHYYPYTDEMCTFVMECDAAAWAHCGFDALDDGARRAFCEDLFADELGGGELISNNSAWRRFEPVTNRAWVDGHRVLIGDAARRAHFSIGSGTRIAMEDSIALVEALAGVGQAHGSSSRDAVVAALRAYEPVRRPAAERLLSAARESYTWYERMGAHAARHAPTRDEPPAVHDFALDFMTRTSRVDVARVEAQHPGFMAALRERRAGARA